MRDFGQRDQSKRTASGCAVDDNQVVVAARRPFFNANESRQFICAGQQCQFIGDDFVDPLIAEQFDEIGANAAPMGFDDMSRVDLERVESLRQTTGLGAE